MVAFIFYMTDFFGIEGATSGPMRGSDPGKPRVDATAAAGLAALDAP
jgi:hypothetical protein